MVIIFIGNLTLWMLLPQVCTWAQMLRVKLYITSIIEFPVPFWKIYARELIDKIVSEDFRF